MLRDSWSSNWLYLDDDLFGIGRQRTAITSLELDIGSLDAPLLQQTLRVTLRY